MKLFIRSCILIIFLLQVFCIGCWDQKNINSLAVITVLGFDRITDVDGLDKWQVSTFMMPAGSTHSTGSGSGSGGGGAGSKEETVWRGTGLTISEAILDITKRSPKVPFFADAYSVIIGERAAKEKLLEIIDYLNRLREQRPGSFVMVTKGNACSLFEAEPAASISVSRELKDLAQNTTDSGIGRGVKVMDFTADLLSSDRDPVAPEVRLITPKEKRGEELAGPSKALVVEGIGIFKDAKLVGWLNKEEAIGYSLITSKITRGDVIIRAKKNGKLFAYLIQKSKPSIKATVVEDKLNINLALKIKGTIAEDGGVSLAANEIEEVESTLSEQIGQMVRQSIDTVRGYESDCLGFSEELHRYNPKDWKKVKPHWRQTFLDANVDVQVNASVENTGRLGQRLELEK